MASPDGHIEGDFLGNKLKLSGPNLIEILLILLIALLAYLSYAHVMKTKEDVVRMLQKDHERLERQMNHVVGVLKVMDHNMKHPDRQYSLEFPRDLFDIKEGRDR
jgi:hypothetical protein